MSTFQPIQYGQDKLGRGKFSERLANTILSFKDDKESIVFGLIGEWGSGKSSILNLMEHHLIHEIVYGEGDKKPIIVRFNPWRISNTEHLIEEFFADLLTKLPKDLQEALKSEFVSLLEMITKVPSPVYVAAVSSVFPGSEVASKVLVDAGKGAANKLGAKLSREKSLEDLKQDICAKLEQFKTPILIIIDDIDRLPTNEIRIMFSLIRSVADFPYTRYLLAVDEVQVVNALKQDNNYPSGDGLDKIIQISVHLPKLKPFSLQQWLGEEIIFHLEKVKGFNAQFGSESNNPVAVQWQMIWYNGLGKIVSTPRKVVKLLQSLKGLLVGETADIFLPDLLAMEAIRLYNPEFYNILRENFDLLDGNALDTQTMKRARKEIVATAEKRGLDDLIRVIFPIFHQGGEHSIENKRLHRVAEEKYLRLYFESDINAETIPFNYIEEFEALLSESGGHEEFFIKLEDEKEGDTGISKLAPFIEEMTVREHNANRSLAEKKKILSIIFDNSERMLLQGDETSGLAKSDNNTRLEQWITSILKSIENIYDRSELLLGISSVTKGLSILVYFWLMWRNPQDPILSDEAIVELDEIILTKIKSSIRNGQLPKLYGFGRALVLWSELEESANFSEYTSSLTDEDDIALLSGALLDWSDDGSGKQYRIRTNRKPLLIDFEALEGKVNSLKIKSLSKRGQEMVRRFKEATEYNRAKIK